MGLKLSSLFARIFSKSAPELRIGMLGLDNAGKTTILYQLKLERKINAIPTIGFNVETIRFGNLVLNVWDVSGRSRTLQLWEHYNQKVKAIIYVVDAADPARFFQAAKELHWLLRRPNLKQAKILLFANKQDLREAVGAIELAQIMGMESCRQQWILQECCALDGSGLNDGLEKLELMLNMGRN